MTQTANIVWSKIMWNSVISTPNAKFDGTNIKNMYLETALNCYEYMKMLLRLIPNNTIKHYGLCKSAFDGYVFMKFRKGMYNLSQSGILANKLLKLCLACDGYFKQSRMPGLWKHVSRPIWFNLCVDNFGIKCIGDKHLKHLFAALWMETYDIAKEWTGDLYCGVSLAWNYDKW